MRKIELIFGLLLLASPALGQIQQTAPTPAQGRTTVAPQNNEIQSTIQTYVEGLKEQRNALADQVVQLEVQIDILQKELKDKSSAISTSKGQK